MAWPPTAQVDSHGPERGPVVRSTLGWPRSRLRGDSMTVRVARSEDSDGQPQVEVSSSHPASALSHPFDTGTGVAASEWI